MAEEIVIRDRPPKRSFVDQFVKGIQLLAETFFFMGCGAVRFAWEGMAKIVKNGQDQIPKRLPFSAPVSAPRPTVRIPILPLDDYNQLNAAEIVKLLATLSPEQLRVLKEFEESNKNRKTVLAAIDQRLSQSG